jgi:hypothetical protein
MSATMDESLMEVAEDPKSGNYHRMHVRNQIDASTAVAK